MPPRFYQQEEDVTGRTLLTMLIFAGMIVAVMLYFILPAIGGIRPTIP